MGWRQPARANRAIHGQPVGSPWHPADLRSKSYRSTPSSLLRLSAAFRASTIAGPTPADSMWVIAAWVVPAGLVTFRRSSCGESVPWSSILAAPSAVLRRQSVGLFRREAQLDAGADHLLDEVEEVRRPRAADGRDGVDLVLGDVDHRQRPTRRSGAHPRRRSAVACAPGHRPTIPSPTSIGVLGIVRMTRQGNPRPRCRSMYAVLMPAAIEMISAEGSMPPPSAGRTAPICWGLTLSSTRLAPRPPRRCQPRRGCPATAGTAPAAPATRPPRRCCRRGTARPSTPRGDRLGHIPAPMIASS